jgi:hypothetical protein
MSGSKRVRKRLLAVLLLTVLIVSLIAAYAVYSKPNHTVYVGVAFGGTTVPQAKELIDRVKNYTNLFILAAGRNPISYNESAVYEVCDYAVSNGLSVIMSLGIQDKIVTENNTWFWHQPNLDGFKNNFTQRWGTKFLGIYYNDEPGGIQIDGNWNEWFSKYAPLLSTINDSAAQAMFHIHEKMESCAADGTKPQDYDLETQFFVHNVVENDPGMVELKASGIPTFTSDYCLYWFDYLGGYDTMLAELGWNCSVSEQIALVKGAARMQNKEWGTMITWKYYLSPYLDCGDQIYSQMAASYAAGANYIAVFDYPYNSSNPYGVLTDEHFDAMQRFWQDAEYGKIADSSAPNAALVLPKDFGWGMRHPNDTIWGFWLTDERTQQVATVTSDLLGRYGVGLDIVFEDPSFPVARVGYKQVYYWNATAI